MIWKTHWNFLYEYTTNLNIISMINVNELCVAVTSRWKLLRKINIVCNSLRIVKLHFQECLDCKDAVRQYTFYTIKNIWYINLIFVSKLYKYALNNVFNTSQQLSNVLVMFYYSNTWPFYVSSNCTNICRSVHRQPSIGKVYLSPIVFAIKELINVST